MEFKHSDDKVNQLFTIAEHIHSKTLMAHLLTVKLNIKPKQTMIFTPLQLSDE